ncbi:MAG: DUF4435 domain-containing protein [Spirulinaceae cyanobacterium]
MFCFFEGKDNAYYVPRIKHFIDDYCPISCGGRDKVLSVHELIVIHPEYDKYKKAFFIDRDFNPPLPPHNPPIFETPCYSIENFYVSVDVFKEIITNVFHLSKVSDSTFPVCLQLFKDRQAEFHNATTLFNAWYACLIEIRNKTGEKTKASLEEKLPKKFISLSLKSVSANYDINTIKANFPDALEVSQEDLEEKIDEFTNCEHRKVFRGKYEMQFLIMFIEQILKDSSQAKEYIKDKIKFRFNQKLTNEQAINVFSSCAETPESLTHYLKQVTQ